MQKLNLPARFDAAAPEALAAWVMHLNCLNESPHDPERGWPLSVVWLNLVDLPGGMKGVDVRPLVSDAWVLRYVCEIRRHEGSPLVIYHHCEYAGDKDALLRHLHWENAPDLQSEDLERSLYQLSEEAQQSGMEPIVELKWQTLRAEMDENERIYQEILDA